MTTTHDSEVPRGYASLPANTRPESRLDGLTTLRFFAATMIVVQHSMGFLGVSEEAAWHLPLAQGVSFFFVLSGFILAYVYRQDWDASRRARFFVARFARIYPVHLLGFVLVLLLIPRSAWVIAEHADVSAAIANLFLVQSWIPLWHFFASFNSPSWSISAEFFFYLAFPLLIVSSARLGLLVTFVVAAAMIALAAKLRLPYGGPGDPGVTATGLLYNNPLPRLFEFALGIFTHAVWAQRRGRTSAWVPSTAYELLGVATIGLSITFSPVIVRDVTLLVPADWRMPLAIYLGSTFSAVPFAVLIYLVANERGLVSRALTKPIGVRLGEISFALYMLHGTFFIFYDAHKAAFAGIPLAARYAMYWIFLLLASWVVWFHVEVPARAGILDWYAARKERRKKIAVLPSAWFSARVPGSGIGLTAIARLFALYLMCVAVAYAIAHPPSTIRLLESAKAVSPAAPNLLTGPVAFDGRITLLRATINTDSAGRRLLDLVWRADQEQRLIYTVAVHLLDDQQTIVGQADFPQDAGQAVVQAGQVWEDARALPPSTTGRRLGIAIFKDREFLIASSGTRDWDGRRLLLPLTPPIGSEPDRTPSADISPSKR